MILPLSEKYRLKSNKLGWAIQERGQAKNSDGVMDEHWDPIKWFTSREAAISSGLELLIRVDDAKGWAEAIKAVERISVEITALLEPHLSIEFKSVKD